MKGDRVQALQPCGRSVSGRTCTKCGKTTCSWAYRVRAGRDADGRWIERRRSGFETKGQAESELTKVLVDINDGTYVKPNALTVAEYLVDRWLPATAPPHVQFQTWEDRRANLENHVLPRIGAVLLQDLTPAHVNRMYTALLTDGRLRGVGGLSPTSVRRLHAILRKALNDAVRWGLLRRNVVPLADPPPARAEHAARRRSMQTWTAEELNKFLEKTSAHPLHRAWYVASTTGLRRSELLGLGWNAVDLRRAVLTVRTTVVPVDEDGYGLEEKQKSATSARSIHLDRRTVEGLARQRHEVTIGKKSVGASWNDHGLVFPQADGSWWNPGSVSHAFDRAVKWTGLRRIRFHDLRHTHATLLLESGVNPRVVSERLGHSSVAFTLDTYAHVLPGMQPEAAQMFSDLVWGDPAKEAE